MEKRRNKSNTSFTQPSIRLLGDSKEQDKSTSSLLMIPEGRRVIISITTSGQQTKQQNQLALPSVQRRTWDFEICSGFCMFRDEGWFEEENEID
mmetsp:Transcript_10968/g.24877  ORF Transcript_10968/g.24877 Transcript_10968/m.24877 type:complete len:94 (-) Transcript_10968:8-289(-)